MKTASDRADNLAVESERRERATQKYWGVLGLLFRWRRFIIIVTGGMAILSVVVSLLLPNWYRASTRLLVPEQSTGGLSAALLGNLSSAAQSLLGGAGGDYIRYMSILTSRRAGERVVDRFNLIEVYDLGDSETPREDALDMLDDNVDIRVDEEFDFLLLEVLDKDPERAANMANFYVELLNEINTTLASNTASSFRRYVEQRYAESMATRDSLLDALESFQRQYGVFDLEAQTAAYFEQLANLRVEVLRTEIQHETLLAQYGAGNARVRAYADAVQAAQRKYQNALAGEEQVLPVPQDMAPQMARQYLNLTLERTIQERILEIVAPMLEQARFEERRTTEAVQVLDPAEPPAKKAKPRRSLIVIAATFSAFILAVVFVLLYDWWARHHADFARRLRAAADGDTPAAST